MAKHDTDRLINRREVERRIGVGKATIYKMLKRGEFPRPFEIAGASRWSLAEVEAWIAERRQVAARPIGGGRPGAGASA